MHIEAVGYKGMNEAVVLEPFAKVVGQFRIL